ncbi:response regulator [Cohnella nanjingensis]|uniref:Circadian input-output histidine kinase CikA n=1 Tax=Cohnella nanjingensis TaxID=1387779 RepID=A0A7X0RRX8_9BACL|nr:response regulator [Cohnella nanjingensis]MBB6672542.1 response regulator [Cohnella nanjingensis]
MKIKTKLISGFTVLLVLQVGITSFGYDRLSRMNDRLESFYDHRFVKVLEVIELRGQVNVAGRIVSDVLTGTSEIDRLAAGQLADQTNDIQTSMTKLAEGQNDADERQMVDRAGLDLELYVDWLKRFAAAIADGDRETALALQKNEGRDRQTAVAGSLDVLVTYEQKSMAQEQEQAKRMFERSVSWVAGLTIAGLLLALGVIRWVFPAFARGMAVLSMMARKFGQGRLRGFERLEVRETDELGDLARVFRQVALDLQAKNEREALYNQAKDQQAWIDAQIARLTELLRDGNDLGAVSQSFIGEFSPELNAAYGAVYLREEDAIAGVRLVLAGAYAGDSAHRSFRIGEGLVGQCAASGRQMTLDALPPGYIRIGSGLGSAEPEQLLLYPLKLNERTIGVIELASLHPFSNLHLALLDKLCEKFAYLIGNIQSRIRVEELLRESQTMTEELQVQSEELISQQEELRQTNEKLERKAGDLKRSEHELQRQQEQLEYANRELTNKTAELEEQIRQTERVNREIAKANVSLERQAMQLSLASKYKTEFLANMSHELRTPLNSMIILSQFLTDNNEGNLTAKQLEYMSAIHASGSDLLKMIEEILDLAKVDAGKMDIYPESTVLEDITSHLEQVYTPIAQEKGLAFAIRTDPDVPKVLLTDGYRLKQILQNLLSNALKFTLEGSVTLHLRKAREKEVPAAPARSEGDYVAFEVTDTGIGIPPEKREVIFEAFRQADGTTSRNFGGTGLGLAISRELSNLLGGWISLESEPGRGSVFTLIVPEACPNPPAAETEGTADREAAAASPGAEREMAAAASGAEPGMPLSSALALAEEEAGPSAAASGKRERGRESGSYAGKTILLVDDDARNVFSLTSLLNHHGMTVISAENGREALEILDARDDVDLVLLDIMMPVMDGYEAMARIRRDPRWRELPILAVTAKAMKEDRNKCLEAGASDYIPKPIQTEQLLSLLKVWLYA